METLKYKIIKSKKQYHDYCEQFETLLDHKGKSQTMKEETELLTFLIEKWDNEHNLFADLDPVQLFEIINGWPQYETNFTG